MAITNITKWEIAEMFGLVFQQQMETDDFTEGDFKFGMGDKVLYERWQYEDTEQQCEDAAKERAAERLLSAIGKCAGKIL